MRTLVIALCAALLVAPVTQEGLGRLRTSQNPDAPVQVARALFGDKALTLLLVNISGRTVQQITIGLTVDDDAEVDGSVIVATPCVATVPPDGFLVVANEHSGIDKAMAYFQQKKITRRGASVGLTQVRFADGSEWKYPLETAGRFEDKPDKAGQDRVRALVEKRFPDKDLSWAVPDAAPKGKFSTCRK